MTDWQTLAPSDLNSSNLRGKLIKRAPLHQLTWLKVGGLADWLFEPVDEADLQVFLRAAPADMPITILGAGSNTLIRDGGIAGAVIRLTGAFTDINHTSMSHAGSNTLTAGGGASDGSVARYSARAGLAGLSFLIGIPGTIGGGLRMNAGAYGKEFKDVLISARGLRRNGAQFVATADEMGLAYRHSDAPQDYIFTSADFTTSKGDADALRAEMKQMIAQRGDSQPVNVLTGGSSFANPEGQKAWQVIDQAGCRGLRVGGAHMSEKHCNFFINDGNASASDLESLGELVRARVMAASGIALRWEIRRIGRDLDSDLGKGAAK